jgi:hypothetical protein
MKSKLPVITNPQKLAGFVYFSANPSDFWVWAPGQTYNPRRMTQTASETWTEEFPAPDGSYNLMEWDPGTSRWVWKIADVPWAYGDGSMSDPLSVEVWETPTGFEPILMLMSGANDYLLTLATVTNGDLEMLGLNELVQHGRPNVLMHADVTGPQVALAIVPAGETSCGTGVWRVQYAEGWDHTGPWTSWVDGRAPTLASNIGIALGPQLLYRP